MAGTPHSACVLSRKAGVSVHGPAIRLIARPSSASACWAPIAPSASAAERMIFGSERRAVRQVRNSRNIGTEQIAAAFHDDRVGRLREETLECLAEEFGDPAATHRIGGGQAEIDAVESLDCPEILVRCDLRNRTSAGRFEGDYLRAALHAQRARNTATPAVVFPASPEFLH